MEDAAYPSDALSKFSEDHLTSDPIELFKEWYSYALTHSNQNDPNAACLSTISENGYPDSRMILLKGFDQSGFIFYTNSLSKKGRSLEAIPRAALNLYWDKLGRQIRIQGDVSKVSEIEADRYFSTRTRGSQLGAWASLQSESLDSKSTLKKRAGEFDTQYSGRDIPRPPHWLGYLVTPIQIEFWQAGKDRLHDRFVYTKNASGWSVRRLHP